MGLMSHLEKEGEVCVLHFRTRKYLEKLYKNYNGPGIGHRYLYNLDDSQYLKANAMHTHNLHKVIQVGQRGLTKEKENNRQMKDELKTLENFSKDLYKQKEILEKWQNDLNLEDPFTSQASL